MRSPRCARLLLLLLLPPLLLTPPAGDAAVITGVSGRAHLSTRDARPPRAAGSWGREPRGRRRGDSDREVGAREGYPGPGHLPHSPLGALGGCPDP